MTDDIQKILEHCESGGTKKLSARQTAKYERLIWVDSVIRQHNMVKSIIIPLIKRKYGFKYHHEADKLYKEAIYLFGKTTKIDKKYCLEVILSKQMKLLKRAEEEGKLELQAKILKDVQDYIAKYESDGEQEEVTTNFVLSIDHNLLENAPTIEEVKQKLMYLQEKENVNTEELDVKKYMNKYGQNKGDLL